MSYPLQVVRVLGQWYKGSTIKTTKRRLYQVVLGASHQTIGSETAHSRGKHLQPYHLPCQLLYQVAGVGDKIVAAKMISTGTSEVLEGLSGVVEQGQ